MSNEDDFEPRLGRQNARGRGRLARPALHAILVATNRARGGRAVKGSRGFTGSRIGRGVGMGQVFAGRDRLAAFRGRRVIVKARIVRLGAQGMGAAKAHLRYIERDGTSRSGERETLYDAASDRADRQAFVDRSSGDRHQFRFIVSPEDGGEYDDLKGLTRRLMSRMEEDLGTRLDWVAADHFDTAHPHVHVIVRGKDEAGKDLVIARDYIRHGMRARAVELVDLDLGPRSDVAIRERLVAEVGQERLTSIDRMLVREADNGLITPTAHDPFQQTVKIGRLRELERLGLAAREEGGWRLSSDLTATLQAMGERGDIIRTMQRAYTARGEEPPPARSRVIFEPASDRPAPLVGRLVSRGLSDEFQDRHYLIIDGADGRSHYVDIGKAEATGDLPREGVVAVSPRDASPRAVDRTIADVARSNDGLYSAELHRDHDPDASHAFAETHVRRLEAMRRALGAPEREADGTWRVGTDHLARAAQFEAVRAREAPVSVEVLSPVPVRQLSVADAATWLDRQLVSSDEQDRADTGFGRDLSQALRARCAWLVEQGLASGQGEEWRYAPDLIERLRRRELLRVAGQLSRELGLRFAESKPGERIEGIYRRRIDMVSGRFALIEQSREFTLVPWRPVLEPHADKVVSGLVRESGISWTFGRQRGGPGIS
ncbi:relaxase/mobilization nuclease RlxS [Novosphingobium sp. PS1R-30]|uniref:Relaxase/mobilization nuclease RlxS n=1 Tax=Novosphingobium anseongense TaxID=3133436 RepID=A0ABU8RTZ3_9SPHN